MLLLVSVGGLILFLGLRPRPITWPQLAHDERVIMAELGSAVTGAFALDRPAPDFSVVFADGRRQNLSDLRGQPVVLNFWATWCVPCKAEMPELQALYSETGAGAGFELLAVNMREAPAPAAAFGAGLGLSFPLVIDPAGLIADSFRVTVLPTTYVIDAEGVVRAQHLGPLDRERLRELLALQP
ncbi:MAG: hypothetical protein OHK0015_12630 [Chloroflexi bacterium OHK40]